MVNSVILASEPLFSGNWHSLEEKFILKLQYGIAGEVRIQVREGIDKCDTRSKSSRNFL
jgi:hypothetical protein